MTEPPAAVGPAMRVAVLDDYQGVAPGLADWSSLNGTTVTFFSDHLADSDRLVARLGDFDAIVVMRERTAFPAALLDRLPRLRLLVTPGMRNAAIDLEAASRLGITVSGVGGSSVATAELAWGLILSLVRQIPGQDAAVRAGQWQSTVGTGLAGRTLGLLGLGTLGRHMARIGRAFDMDVVAWSQHLAPETAREVGALAVPRDELFRAADVLSIHLVLGARTRHLVGTAELALMKPTAYLVNTSRAGIVDRAALLAALHAGRLAGAGLDVFDEEPLPADDPVLAAPRTVLTPHLGFVTREVYEGWYAGAVEDLAAFRLGKPVRVLNAPVGRA